MFKSRQLWLRIKPQIKRLLQCDAFKTVALLSCAVMISELIRPYHVGEQNMVMVYILFTVLISRTTNGYVYGVVATVIAAFVYDYLISDPRLGFSFTLGFPITLLIMLIVTLLTSTITNQMKMHASLAQEREQRAELLYKMNQAILSSRDYETIIKLTLEYASKHLQCSVIFYTHDPLKDRNPYFLNYHEDVGQAFFALPEQRKAAHDAYVRQEDDSIVPQDGGACYLQVSYQNKVLGVLGASLPKGRLSTNSVYILNMFISQMALALELQLVSDQQRQAMVEAQTEKMRSNLLRAISHDLRTPLTSILGASSAILEQEEQLDKAMRDTLMRNIKEDSQWLIRMVENLLTVTRIAGETLKVTKTTELVEEVVAEATAIVRKRYPDVIFAVSAPQTLLLVPMDAMLITQVLINLYDNAAKNTPKGVPVVMQVKQEGGHAVFEVFNQGKPISAQLMPHLFNMGAMMGRTKSAGSPRGMGIGLSICKTIIQAHGGTIEGMNKDNGVVFRFCLPLE